MNRRAKIREELHALFLPLYDALCAELGEHWQPYYGLRTFDEQDKLYAQGRTAPGNIVTRARGGQSPHNYGLACDWCIWEGSRPIWPPRDDVRWRELEQACEKVGARWGGHFAGFWDGGHVEFPIKQAWSKVFEVYKALGREAALKFIERHKE